VGTDIKLQIWRLADHDRFSTVRQLYYRGASGVILTFDTYESFLRIERFLEESWHNSGRGIIPVALVSQRLPDVDREVVNENIQRFIDYYDTMTADMDDQPNIRYFELEQDRYDDLEELIEWLARKFISFSQIRNQLGNTPQLINSHSKIIKSLKEVIDDIVLVGVTMDENNIYVQGNRAKYSISVRTKEVHAVETGKKICIIPKTITNQQYSLLLPFIPYQNHHVSEIISKIFLLLDDWNLPPDIESKLLTALG
jgi:hypothetical protein